MSFHVVRDTIMLSLAVLWVVAALALSISLLIVTAIKLMEKISKRRKDG